jgi:two-component system sensor histidine kinase KdpD
MLANELQLEVIDLSVMLLNVAKEMNGVSGAHPVRVDVAPDVRVLADDRALWQVLWHLGENAIKYSPAGGTIEWHAVTNDARAIITLTDEGLGVPDDVDVFEPFTRSAEERFGGISGTGLGLHIVRNLTHAMRGSVTAEHRTDRTGSRFTVSLPSP